METKIGIANPEKMFDHFVDEANKRLTQLKEVVTAPNKEKVMRAWGVQDAARFIGRSPQYIRQNEGDGKLLGLAPTDDRGRRAYTLADINRYRDILGTRYKRPLPSCPIICAVTNFKGGSAKTQTCLTLAQRCALEGLRVLAIDMDPQGSLTLFFGHTPDLDFEEHHTIGPTLRDDIVKIHNVIQPTYFTGLDLVASNLALQDTEYSLYSEASAPEGDWQKRIMPANRLEAALKLVEDRYDVILLDCGPNLGMLTMNALRAANSLLVPIQPQMVDLGSAVQFFATLQQMMSNPVMKHSLDFFRVLLTRHTGSIEANTTEAMMRLAFKGFLLSDSMVHSVAVERAGNDFGSVYEALQDRGSSDALKRAMDHLEAVNGSIIEMFKQVWENQASNVTADAVRIAT